MKKLFYLFIGTMLIYIYGCQKPYSPQVVIANSSSLVVEGFINTGADSTIIKLSRTVLLSNKTTANVETKAIIFVENAQGTQYPLTETVKGTYASPGLNLSNSKQYRLRIKTSNGQTYLSDLVDAKVSPPIDSVGYTVLPNYVQLYTNTHDPANNTIYYRYTFSETWQFHPYYASNWVTDGNILVFRTTANDITYCFASDSSKDIIINSTAALAKDVVYQFPITNVISSAEKLETKYSILLTQQPLTKEAYTFWSNMKNNTVQLGGIFDPLPSQISGNIHNVANSLELVTGFISAGTTTHKRIFIDRGVLPTAQNWQRIYPYDGCEVALDTVANCDLNGCYGKVATLLIPLTSKLITVARLGYFPPWNFSYTTRECGDCTLRGTVKTPPFWK